jgi:hypothetical protein
MRSARSVERPFSPLDEQLALLPGGLMPFMHECLVRLAAWMPFEKAAQFMEEMLGVVVSPATVTRCTEAAGAAYVRLQTEEADRIEQTAPAARVGAEKMVLSADGAMVPLRHGEWGEVRTLALGAVQAAIQEQDAWVVHTRGVSYFSRLVDARRFEHLSLVEIHRRGLEHSQQVAAVTDGADWLQSLIDYHCPQALRILDFPHAAQRFGQVGQALLGEGTPEAQQWIGDRLHQLKHQGPTQLLQELRSLLEQHPELEVLKENLAYLEKREPQLHYPQFQAQGWPIGSGMVESGNKLVVEARLKGAGMHWRRENVNPMLGLRNVICSDRWSQEWPLIARQLRREARERCRQNREKRRLAKLPIPTETAAKPPPVEPRSSSQEKAPEKPRMQATRNGPKKPAANHPWRRSPIGRARYQPSKNAKN